MGASINVYNLGLKGVVLTKSQTHNDDGELSSAQNAVLDSDAREGAIRKRPGLVKVNSVALTGSVLGAIHVPLPDAANTASVTKTLYAAREATSGVSWRTSTDGTTWANATSPTYVQLSSKITGFDNEAGAVALRGRIYFLSNDYTAYPTASHTRPPVNSWDGTTDSEIFTIPLNIDAGASTNENGSCLLNAEDKLYIATFTDTKLRVLQYNPETGRLVMVGPTISAAGTAPHITDMAWFEGRLWACTDEDGAGKIYSIRPPSGTFVGDTTWVTEYNPGTTDILNMAAYKGLLYAGQSDGDVVVRSSLGAFTVSDNQASGARMGMIVYNDELYAAHRVGATNFTYRKFDGTSWTEAADVDALVPLASNVIHVGKPVLFGGNMYVVVQTNGFNSAVLKNASGTWTSVDAALLFRGFLAVLETGI